MRGRVVLRARDGGGVTEEPADAVVLVSHPTANRAADELAASFDVHLVGDAASPRDLPAAVADGNRVGRAL